MVGLGFLMILLALIAVWAVYKEKLLSLRWFLTLLMYSIAFPYIANTAGWFLTEMGRYPWLVFGLFKIEDGISPNVSVNMLWISLLVYIIIYTLLIGATLYLFKKFASAGPSITDAGIIALDAQSATS
jgi:cytochrome d ubiquinol oxidase subunit I